MVLGQYKPTRSQLLLVRKTKKTAERGHRLLKLKRDALIVEFFRVLDRAKKMRSNLVEKYAVAEQRIAVARAVEGAIGVKSAAFAILEKPTLDLKTRNVMGIVVPRIEARAVKKTIEQRGYGIIQTSARIDEAAEAYEDLVENIIVAAEIETTMRRLIEEIEKVKRRVNALEYRVIPELIATEAWIRQRLDEMERDNFMRLKRFKQVAETRQEEQRRAATD
jgi:V/A-type H+-transporting ATPase subunit D